MAVLARLSNPILWQEYTHQQRSGPRWMRWGTTVSVLAVGAALTYVLYTLGRPDHPTRESALFVIWVTHILVATRCIVAGANAISREHVSQTWDALVLTGVSGKRILFGKYRAALARVGVWALALGVVRLVMLPIFIMAFINRIGYYRYWRFSSTSYESLSWSLDLVPESVILAVTMTVGLTLLEVLCCTALGLACSAVFRRGSTATAAAMLIRFAPVALFAAFTRYELGAATPWRMMRFAPFALADGGTSPLYQLILPVLPWTRNRHIDALPGLFLATLLILLTLGIALAIAFVAIRRTGALPHPKEETLALQSAPITERRVQYT